MPKLQLKSQPGACESIQRSYQEFEEKIDQKKIG